MESMITIQQAADELGVSKSRVFQYVREGRLQVRRVGIQDLIERTHFDAMKPGIRKSTTGRPKGASKHETGDTTKTKDRNTESLPAEPPPIVAAEMKAGDVVEAQAESKPKAKQTAEKCSTKAKGRK